jgi:predicted Zn-dependent peptidase
MFSSIRTLGTAIVLCAPALLLGCPKTDPVTVAPAPTPEPAPESPPDESADGREYPDPPPPGDPKPVNFPNVASFKLPSGLLVYVVENHEVPVVSIQLVVRAGEMDAALVPDMTAQMLGEGTSTRSKANIDQAIEFVGGGIGAGSGMHATYVFGHVLKKDLKLGLTLVADEVMHPAFPEDALSKLKDREKTILNFSKSQPQALAAVLFDEVAYPQGHPYGRPFPTVGEIEAVTVADLKQFHGTFYRANNAFLVLAGDITQAEAQPLVKRALGGWASAKKQELPPNPLNKFKDYSLPKELTVHLVDRPASAQTEILVGNLALARSHKDWAKLWVANSILGDGASGRLFIDVREKRGLAYNIGSDVSDGQAPGTFYISTRTRTKTTGEMLAALFGHIKAIRSEAPSGEEVSNAVAKLIGGFPLEIETPDDIAAKMREALIYNLPADYWAGFRDQLAAVTPEQVHEAARKYVHPIPHVVVVGNAEKIEPQVQKVLPKAKIVKYDAELNKL